MASAKRIAVLRVFAFVLYISLLIYLVLFSAEFGRVAVSRNYNLKPFSTISMYFKHRKNVGELNFIINIYGNILAFIPLGYFIFRFQKRHLLRSGFFIPLIVSGLIEISQYLLSVGSLDVDDLILNTLGGFVMYMLLWILFKLGVIK